MNQSDAEKAKHDEPDQYAIIFIDVDNYDELMEDAEDYENEINSAISRVIRTWGQKMEASVTRYNNRHFIIMVEEKYLEKEEEKNFPILEETKKIKTETEFPVTLSVGVGVSGRSPAENDTFAVQGVDIAKGRGGDQVVVNTGEELRYYGGKSPSVEKRNKGKSRIMGYALRSLVDRATQVFIMGHKNPDMDCFGAALGMYRFAKTRYKKAYIVVDEMTEALDVMYDVVASTGNYDLITSEEALSMVKHGSLAIMVDTNRVEMSTCPELYDRATRTVIIDHHRMSKGDAKEPTFAYMETYASSASELVTEILQYTIDRRQLKKAEANGLLAGIMLDTNSFSAKAGVRTFEAAAWLKRAGAEITEIKKFFQVSSQIFMLKAECFSNAQITDDGFAFAVYTGKSASAQMINAQVADELLAVRGVKATFVASQDHQDKTFVSARSLEEINVQLIMEELGGGGRLTTAGAQVDIAPKEAIKQIKRILKEQKEETAIAKEE